jgi:hypothetical protein
MRELTDVELDIVGGGAAARAAPAPAALESRPSCRHEAEKRRAEKRRAA